MKGCRPFTESEVEAILKAVDGNRHALRDRAFIVLGLRTGFRVSELLSLTIGHVWKNGRVVDLLEVPRRSMKGKNNGRTVLLADDAKAAIADLVEYMVGQDVLFPGTYLFRSQKGANNPISKIYANDLLKAAAASAGVVGAIGTHSLRKTFAAEMFVLLDRNLFDLQNAMGHKDPKSTASYLSFDQDRVNNAIRALGRKRT